jgi:YtxH-like protein
MRTNGVKDALWFTAGLGIGVGATWFFATKSGKRTQQKLVSMTEDCRDKVVETGREFLDKGKDLVERSMEMAGESRNWVGQKLHVAK